jgi:hypothetical protein
LKPKNTWKKVESKVASFFGTKRTPLSGGNSYHTRSDTLHNNFFIETKYRASFSVISLWRQTALLAKKENKIPIVCLAEKNKNGFWILVHSDDFNNINCKGLLND